MTDRSKLRPLKLRPLKLRPLSPAELQAERLARSLDVPVTTAGFLFLLIVVVDTASPAGSTQSRVLSIASWLLWLLFIVEFAARLVMARSTSAFLRRNWWQIIFLALPFLRFLRTFSRTARLARLGSSSLRSSRSATAALGSRVALLASWTATLVLAGATALFEFGEVRPIGSALEASTLAAIAGEPVDVSDSWARGIAVLLVIWSAIGFATLAGSVGAFLVQRHAESDPASQGRHQDVEDPAIQLPA